MAASHVGRAISALLPQIDASKGPFGGRSKELERALQALDVSAGWRGGVHQSGEEGWWGSGHSWRGRQSWGWHLPPQSVLSLGRDRLLQCLNMRERLLHAGCRTSSLEHCTFPRSLIDCPSCSLPGWLHPLPAQWEQKSLAQHLKWNYTDEQRDALMQVRGTPRAIALDSPNTIIWESPSAARAVLQPVVFYPWHPHPSSNA